MTVEPPSHKGDMRHSARQAVPDEKEKIDILPDSSALNPSGIIGTSLIVTYFSRAWNDLDAIC